MGARVGSVPEFIGVVIPANDEAETVSAAVDAVRRAADDSRFGRSVVTAVVVDDRSSDATGERAAATLGRWGRVLRVEEGCAGAARRAGFVELSRWSDGLEPEAVWLATTDADTVVSSDWLVRQAAWWRRGADAVAGIVKALSWEGQPDRVRQRYEAYMYRLGRGFDHPHVYGANLGLTKAAYLQAGGITGIETGEDHALWDAVVANGQRALSVPDVVVATSTRREGRAPHGFSALLRSLGESR
jgi:glycosyltransferase involved in cell wall biosynthesis